MNEAVARSGERLIKARTEREGVASGASDEAGEA
jgi:hypothetical protein